MQLAAWQPDLLVVAAYGQILSKDVLAAASKGGINVHASLLPKYRGAAPIAWAIYHGEQETEREAGGTARSWGYSRVGLSRPVSLSPLAAGRIDRRSS